MRTSAPIIDGDDNMRAEAQRGRGKPRGAATRVSGVTQNCQLLTVKQLAGLLCVDVRSCWRLVSRAEAGLGDFPKPLRLSAKTIRWRLTDVEAFLAEQAGANAAGKAPSIDLIAGESGCK
jgi:predicted DNA-binding transcriptional regulator AlpA